MPLPRPVESFEQLHQRVVRLLSENLNKTSKSTQLDLDFERPTFSDEPIVTPASSVYEFLQLACSSLPDGEVYLFGGILRDLALYGRKGFKSDIDLVVEGDWTHLAAYLEHLGAQRNKFGGYRLTVGSWPIDIWNARDTWAVKHFHVEYRGISSLLDTTVLNWDSVLMNWRTGNFISHPHYLEMLQNRLLHVVLEHNPNPLGMAVRVFRHLSMKDARKITVSAANYLAKSTQKYSFEELRTSELRSYGQTCIDKEHYNVFRSFSQINAHNDKERWFTAVEIAARQHGLGLNNLVAIS